MTKPDRSAFERWKGQVNLAVAKATGGLTADDLPDAPYYDWYDAGVGPKAAARMAIREEW